MTAEMSFPAEQAALRRARGDARAAAQQLGAAERICDTVALVVDELVNNAIEHGAPYRRAGLPLTVRLVVAGTGLAIEFYDREMPSASIQELHAALVQAGDGAPALDSERGRGLFLLSIYLERIEVREDSGGGLRLRGVVVEGSD